MRYRSIAAYVLVAVSLVACALDPTLGEDTSSDEPRKASVLMMGSSEGGTDILAFVTEADSGSRIRIEAAESSGDLFGFLVRGLCGEEGEQVTELGQLVDGAVERVVDMSFDDLFGGAFSLVVSRSSEGVPNFSCGDIV
jgi:hypothetical protein